ncbi:MAG TPA: tripartite tricarboxylate transporter substrate binding protein [Xanthobacteraceae bacterium]|nr:tripartite tricarboxylate transporter substrate binding protein [Xanthobacteraceae bacterium]
MDHHGEALEPQARIGKKARPTHAALAALLALAGALASTGGGVHADPFPSRPIRLIVPFPPGGPADVMGRLIGQCLTATLGQAIVDNRPGAGSTLGAREVARADPDGYTLLVGSAATNAIGPTLYRNIGYDPATAFTAVAAFSSTPYVMVTGAKTAANSVRGIIADAKAHPGKLNVGVPNGAPPHMIAVWFKDATATDIVIVPYKGAATVITDLIGGQIDLAFETTSVTLAHLRDGSIRPLGVATRERLPDLPDVPTLIESGVPDFVADSWIGVLAPAGTPAEIVDRLNAAINAGLQSPDIQARLKALASQPQPGPPQAFAALMAAENPKWTAMAKLSNLKPE